MARKPPNFEWLGYTDEQLRLLNSLDHAGNNGWSRNSYTEERMPRLLADCEQAGLTLDGVKEAMSAIGYRRDELHELDRWESKRTTGRFGK